MAACKRCGTELPPGALTCPTCPPRVATNPWAAQSAGPLGATPAYNTPAQPYAPPQYAASSTWIDQVPGASPIEKAPKAGFGIRLLAFLIDFFITVVGGGLLDAAVNAAVPSEGAWVFEFIVSIAQFMYWPAMWSDYLGNGQTIGMRVFHLRLLRKSTGRPITITRAVGRDLVLLLLWWLGWLAAFDPDKQAPHDKIVDTVVVVER